MASTELVVAAVVREVVEASPTKEVNASGEAKIESDERNIVRVPNVSLGFVLEWPKCSECPSVWGLGWSKPQ